MGEAMYYLKVGFNGDESSNSPVLDIKNFLHDGILSSEFWHSVREKDFKMAASRKQRKVKSSMSFLEDFSKKFPVVYKYVMSCGGVESPIDILSEFPRYLNFGSQNELESNFKVRDGAVMYEVCHNARVWHCADWSGICKFLLGFPGVVSSGWLSSEHLSDTQIFSLIKLEGRDTKCS
jgi:hypothetical protein